MNVLLLSRNPDIFILKKINKIHFFVFFFDFSFGYFFLSYKYESPWFGLYLWRRGQHRVGGRRFGVVLRGLSVSASGQSAREEPLVLGGSSVQRLSGLWNPQALPPVPAARRPVPVRHGLDSIRSRYRSVPVHHFTVPYAAACADPDRGRRKRRCRRGGPDASRGSRPAPHQGLRSPETFPQRAHASPGPARRRASPPAAPPSAARAASPGVCCLWLRALTRASQTGAPHAPCVWPGLGALSGSLRAARAPSLSPPLFCPSPRGSRAYSRALLHLRVSNWLQINPACPNWLLSRCYVREAAPASLRR